MKTALSQARTAVRGSSSLSANFTLAEPPPCDALLVDLPPVPPVSDVFRNDSGSAFGGSSSGSAAGAGSARVSSAGGGSAGAGVGARRQ